MLKTIVSVAVIGVTLASCSQKQMAHTSPMFGIWKVNEQTCMLEAERGGMVIRTDGRMSADMLYFKLTSPLPLARTPSIMANNLHTLPIRLEGTDRFFSFELPYTPHVASKLLDENSFFVVDYRGQNIERSRKELFNTAGLSAGISYIAKTCLNY